MTDTRGPMSVNMPRPSARRLRPICGSVMGGGVAAGGPMRLSDPVACGGTLLSGSFTWFLCTSCGLLFTLGGSRR